jgi:hypothetical protein
VISSHDGVPQNICVGDLFHLKYFFLYNFEQLKQHFVHPSPPKHDQNRFSYVHTIVNKYDMYHDVKTSVKSITCNNIVLRIHIVMQYNIM